MKTIFFGEAAKDSGSFGFSDACPLFTSVSPSQKFVETYHPAQTACTFIRSAISTINSTFA
jgi:hypothetical protein